MRNPNLICIVILTCALACLGKAPRPQYLYDVYAGPFNVFGPEEIVYSVFGENTGCSLSVVDGNTGGVIRLQVKADRGEWMEYTEGDRISAQVVRVRAASVGTGGWVRIRVNW